MNNPYSNIILRNSERVYTTGDLSKIISVSTQTISIMFDKGFIEGYKVPLSQDRRFTHISIIELIEQNNIPISFLENFLLNKEENERRKSRWTKRTYIPPI